MFISSIQQIVDYYEVPIKQYFFDNNLRIKTSSLLNQNNFVVYLYIRDLQLILCSCEIAH